jgi:hypothetical protein
MLIGKNFAEKRDFIRMQINSPAILNQDGVEYKGICKDLSSTGMLIAINHDFDLGIELKVSFAPQSEAQPAFNAITEVLRSDAIDHESNPEMKSYILGLSIKQII